MDTNSNTTNSLNRDTPDQDTSHRGGWHSGAIIALGAALLGVAGFGTAERSDVSALSQQASAHQEEIATLQTQLSAADASLEETAGKLHDQLASEEAKTSDSISRVRSSAIHHADTVAQNVKATIERKASEQQEALNAELAGVKNATSDAASRIDTAYNKIDGVGAQVDSVKTDLASTKSTVDDTVSELQSARGDLGVMSGLIATNSKEIQELRDRGDRNIYEFTIAKKDGPQKVGDVQIRLNKSDAKKSIYTISVLANDRYIEKKDKTANEPVQFYVGAGSRTPDEVVVNDVTKDSVKGYLATSKVTTATR